MKFMAGLRENLLGVGNRLERPTVLQFPVNDICNSRCQMCHIWQKKQKSPISIEELRTGLANPLFDRVRAVGLNGGEPTLRRDLSAVAQILGEKLPRLESVSLITNAINEQQVIERIGELSEAVHGFGATLDVMVSIDGYEGVHDLVRGRDGNFESAVRVLDWLASNKVADNVRVGCTVISDNVYGLHDLHRFCRARDQYVKYRLGIPHKRLYTGDLGVPFQLDDAQRLHFATFLQGIATHYEPSARQRHFYRSLIGQLKANMPRKAGCDWQYRGATLTSRGEVLYCAVESPVIGSLRSPTLEQDYFGSEPVLQQIRRDKCTECHHDYVGVPDGNAARRILVETLLDRTGQKDALTALWRGLGLKDIRQKAAFAQKAKAIEGAAGCATDEMPAAFVVGGWYGTETLGDKAILGAIVTSLRRIEPGTPVVLVSLDPAYSRQTVAQMPELAGVEVVDVDSAPAWATTARAVIMGGGPLMHIDEVLAIRELFRCANANHRPTVIAGCGVGPVDTLRHRRVISDIVRLSNVNIFRDAASARRAKDLAGPIANVHVTNDPAFAWLQAKSPHRSAGRKRELLLGLRAFPANEYAPQMGVAAARAVREQLDQTIVDALVDVASTMPDLTVVPLPMCTNAAGGDDRFYYDDLFRLTSGLSERIDYSLLSRELAPDEYLRSFRDAGAALTMRFHSLVFALQSRTPTVAIDYTLGKGKVASLADLARVPVHNPIAIDRSALARDIMAAIASERLEGEIISDSFADCFERELGRVLGQA